ncbi:MULTISPECIES: chemotaxis protein CheD [Acidocella]|uniref:chemotaxis protein CheD n=1 Tax=Acidocella TaxID=50709 RepID=UPI00028D882A|nr:MULTISPECIES: chemotaxis protein CheD [Acidocella]EKN00124.1 chemoreceptor glutamine deamidase CheD [Acidocella sp. MX-AZ02]WBO59697.1 chemotaxis protein CheD [Acidocella sp. MX-AZ03]
MSLSNLSSPAGREKRINIVQGFHHVDNDPNAVLTTILGSCIAACIWDPAAKVGGMNHFLLPGDANARTPAPRSDAQRYGVNLMELLINDLLRMGAHKPRMKAKLFGGAAMIKGLTDIGALNASFAEAFLREEGIELVGGSLRGVHGRRIQFWPVGGRARQALLQKETESIMREETTRQPVLRSGAGQVELF